MCQLPGTITCQFLLISFLCSLIILCTFLPQLPILCEFQSVRYKVVISSGGDPVLQLSRVFSYSSGYSSLCIEEKVNDTLKVGTEYEVQVFLPLTHTLSVSVSSRELYTLTGKWVSM